MVMLVRKLSSLIFMLFVVTPLANNRETGHHALTHSLTHSPACRASVTLLKKEVSHLLAMVSKIGARERASRNSAIS